MSLKSKPVRKIILLSIAFCCVQLLSAQEVQTGEASYYNDKFHGSLTALGVKYDKNKYTCAHRTHNFGTLLKVTRLDNKKSVVVKVNDRGPFKEGRVVDLSRAAAEDLDLINDGVAQVKVEVVSSPDVSAINRRVVPQTTPQSSEFTAKGTPANVPASYDKILNEEAVVKSSSEDKLIPRSV
ncbi:MAG: septal ring lytic transglycosylase RlpA family protein, partial [Saprospiraceae bacterium]|nr:septal ring lytic transglycosylase RlpA family protein [Saprospiraceae bacterium]